MFKNAVEKLNKFYEFNFSQNPNRIFEILSGIIEFNSAAIFYLTPNTLSLEFEKNFTTHENIKIGNELSSQIYDTSKHEPVSELHTLLGTNSKILVKRLIVKGAVLGIIVITRDTAFTQDEETIFNTCASIISNLIKDIEISKVLKMQVEALQNGIIEITKLMKQ